MQYGGPDGELGASLRYLSQRYAMPYPELKGLLTDIGTEGSFLHIGPKPLQSLVFSEVGSADTVGSFFAHLIFCGLFSLSLIHKSEPTRHFKR